MVDSVGLAQFPAGTSAVAALLSEQPRPVLLDRLRAETLARFAVVGAHGGAGRAEQAVP